MKSLIRNKKKRAKIFKLSIASLAVVIFFAFSYFVFLRDVEPDLDTFFPTNSGIVKVDERAIPFKQKEAGSWLWTSPLTLNNQSWIEILDFAKEQNITTIYLDITDYTDIYEMIDIDEKENKTAEFTAALRNKVRTASEKGIAVEALAGQNYWGNSSHWYLPLEIVSYVQKYNAESQPEEKLAGIQFDIEPAEQPDFDTADKQLILMEFLMLVDGISSRIAAESPGLRIGFAIPFWFDGSSDRVGNIEYKGNDKPASEHIIDLLAKNHLGYIALMTYRNKASGENGSIEQAKKEFDYIEEEGLNTKIILGQEFTPIDESGASFYGMGRNNVLEEVSSLRDAYESDNNFLGIAYHDLPYFQRMIERAES